MNRRAQSPTLSDAAPTVEVCSMCGVPLERGHCRNVEAGYWCQQGGLVLDYSRLLGQAPADPLAGAVEADPKVTAARTEYERLTALAETATAVWEKAALAEWQARQRRRGTQEFVADGQLHSIIPSGASDADLRRLDEAQREANTQRSYAAEKAIKARQQLDAARARARRRLAAAAVKAS